MFKFRVRLSPHVQRPLERELIEGTHPREPWDRRIYALTIHEMERVLQPPQLLAEFRTEPRLSRLYAGTRTPLSFTQGKVSRYVGDGLDAQLLQFLGGTGMESWQKADVVIWAWGIAAVEEFTRDGVRAMRTSRDIWSFRHEEHAEFRPKQESELRQKPLDSPRQVLDLEEPSHIDGAALKHIVSIDVGEARGSQIHP